jgi:hypothetical protein
MTEHAASFALTSETDGQNYDNFKVYMKGEARNNVDLSWQP